MMQSFKLALLGVLLVQSVTMERSEASGSAPLVALEVEAEENTLDGCTACGCRATGELELGGSREWWISYGLVKPDAHGGWRAVGSPSRCARGSYDEVAVDFRQTIGIPYLILDLSVSAEGPSGADVRLETDFSIQKLSGFDRHGKPIYARSKRKRRLRFESAGEFALPLLIPDARERESFGVHEVLLRLRATALSRGPAASYGVLSVAADVPGAEILLDGGVVGRISEGTPTLLSNVRTGTREVRVRDFSAREARRQVVVEGHRTSEVELRVLNPNRSAPLVAIGKNPQGSEEFWRARDGAMVVWIPAGEFLMGSPEG